MEQTIDVAAVVRLLDRQAIWDCMLRYARGVDRMDLDLVRSAFWEDATDSHGPTNGSVEDLIAAWYPAQAGREVSFHMVSNQQLDFDDDGQAAHGETYFIAGIRPLEGDQMELVGGRYVDHYTKRGEQWRIGTRVVLLDWQGLADGSQMAQRKASRHTGSRDKNDPSYERPVRPRDAVATSW